MKQVLTLIALALVCACHPLESVADKVPVSLICPDPDTNSARALVGEFTKSPDVVIERMRKRVSRGPEDAAVVVCELLDVKRYLEDTKQQATEAYQETVEALEALGAL